MRWLAQPVLGCRRLTVNKHVRCCTRPSAYTSAYTPAPGSNTPSLPSPDSVRVYLLSPHSPHPATSFFPHTNILFHPRIPSLTLPTSPLRLPTLTPAPPPAAHALAAFHRHAEKPELIITSTTLAGSAPPKALFFSLCSLSLHLVTGGTRLRWTGVRAATRLTVSTLVARGT